MRTGRQTRERNNTKKLWDTTTYVEVMDLLSFPRRVRVVFCLL